MSEGNTRSSRTVELLRTHDLSPLRRVLTAEIFASAGVGSFRKSMVLIPEIVFWLMICVALGDGTMAAAIGSFWSNLKGLQLKLPLEPLCEEAFCKARKRLKVEFLERVFQAVVSCFDKVFGDRFKWRGFNLLAMDGTDPGLPTGAPKLLEAFPAASNKHGSSKHPQALLVGLVNVWTGICRDFSLGSLKNGGEQARAKVLCRSLRSDDLLLGDRNFPGVEVMARVRETGAQLLMRLSGNRFMGPTHTRQALNNPNEWLVTLKIPKKLRQECPTLGETLTLRILKYEIPGYRPSYLITSLVDPDAYPYEELVALYHERWRQETFHREWKCTLTVSNLRSKSPDGILKELFVQLTLNNALRYVMAEAAEAPLRPVDLQFKACKRLVIAAINRMARARPDQINRSYENLKRQIARQRILVRPGRCYPRRKNEQRGKNKGGGRIVKPAKLLPTETASSPLLPQTPTPQQSAASP